MEFQNLPYIIVPVLLVIEFCKQNNMEKIIYKIDNFYALLLSGNLIAYILTLCNPMSIISLRELNAAAEKLEKLQKEQFGDHVKLPRYNLIDFFI